MLPTVDEIFAEIDGHPLRLSVTLPDGVPHPPLVVWIHGGGWRNGSYKNNRLAWLTEHGYATASISYRLTDRATFPAQIHDCKAAIRWLRAHAARLGYDGTRIAAAGSSAGAHLAMLLGTSAGNAELEGHIGGNLDCSSAVTAVVQYFGPSDFILRAKTQPHSATSPDRGSFKLLNGHLTGHIDMDLARLASPAFHVSAESPPLISIQGLADDKVLPDQAERITDAYQAVGRPCELYRVPGAGHGSKQCFEGEYREAVIRFLQRYL